MSFLPSNTFIPNFVAFFVFFGVLFSIKDFISSSVGWAKRSAILTFSTHGIWADILVVEEPIRGRDCSYPVGVDIIKGVMPHLLKISKITPIDKGGDALVPTYYRPISTLSPFTQIFEKLICKQLLNYIEKQQILNVSIWV